jgi:hypothetical protein
MPDTRKFFVVLDDESITAYSETDMWEVTQSGALRVASRRSGEVKKVYAAGWWREIQY